MLGKIIHDIRCLYSLLDIFPMNFLENRGILEVTKGEITQVDFNTLLDTFPIILAESWETLEETLEKN